MFCKRCGNPLNGDEHICNNCGAFVTDENVTVLKKNAIQQKCLPSFILGLIGSIFGLFGGFCTMMCTFYSRGDAAFYLIFCSSIIGLIGACLCLNRARIGSILELIAAVMIIICAYGITGSDLMTIFAMLLLLFGGVIGVIYTYIVKRK